MQGCPFDKRLMGSRMSADECVTVRESARGAWGVQEGAWLLPATRCAQIFQK